MKFLRPGHQVFLMSKEPEFFMSWLDVILGDILVYLFPAEEIPEYFWIVATVAILVAAVVMKWRGPEVEGGVMDQI